MKIELEINNQTSCLIPKKFIERVVRATVEKSGEKKYKDLTLSIGFVGGKEIRRINRIYRKKNEITDILSFSDLSVLNKRKLACELVICCSYVKKSSKKHRVSFKKELAYVVAHGILHCLGWKHSREMYMIQDKISSVC